MTREPILVIESQPERELDIRTLGRVRVRQPGLRFDRQLAWRRRRPLAANHRVFATAAIVASLDPPCGPTDVDQLPDRERRRLMRAVVHVHGEERMWRRLAGSFLSADERFFAVMLWAAEREQAEHRRVLAELRNARDGLHRDLSVTPNTLRTTYGVADVSRKLQLAFGLTDTWTRLQKNMDFYLRGPFDAWESLKGVLSASHASAATRALTLGTSTAWRARSDVPMRPRSRSMVHGCTPPPRATRRLVCEFLSPTSSTRTSRGRSPRRPRHGFRGYQR
jgi:hypothetical protein